MQIQGGIVPQVVKLEKRLDLVGPSISIALAEEPGTNNVWTIEVFVQFETLGTSKLGEFVTNPPAAGDPPNRIVAFASCPGAKGWFVQAKCLANPSALADLNLDTSDCCSGTFGVVPNPIPITPVGPQLEAFRKVRPLGGGLDDWLRLFGPGGQASIAANLGQQLVLLPGINGEPYHARTLQQIPNFLTILGTPETRIIQHYTNTTVDNTAFYHPVAENASTTSATNEAIGAQQITVAADVATVGQYIAVFPPGGANQRLQGHSYQVVAKTGLVYTLGRDIIEAVSTGYIVTQIDPAQNITILGNGMSVSGTGARYIELQAAQQCKAQDMKFDPVDGSLLAGNFSVSFDTWCYQSHFQDMTFEGGSTGITGGFALETADSCNIARCNVTGCLTGILVKDGCDNAVEDSTANSCTNGVDVGSGTGGLGGARGTRLSRVRAYGNSLQGILIQALASQTVLEGCKASGNGTGGAGGGLGIGADAAGPTFATGCDFDGNTINYASPGTSEVHLKDVNLSNPSSLGILAQGGLQILDGIIALNAQLQLSNCAAEFSHSHVTGIVWVKDGARVTFDDDNIQATAAGFGFGIFVDAGSFAYVDATKITKAAGAFDGIGVAATATLRVGNDFDADTCTNAVTVTAGGFFNRGQVLANGAGTLQTVTWTDIKSTERVSFSLHTIGGTVGKTPLTEVVAGAGFNVTFNALDSSLYDFVIE